MNRVQDNPSLNDQVEDLRERMRLLQGDRKANIDILEANKTANKEEIRRLRDENKDVRMKLSQLGRGSNQGDEVSELEHMQREIHRLCKLYNTVKSKSVKSKQMLQKLKDEVRDLELEARQPNREDSPLTRKIRMLENRLDKAMIKYNEAQSIRKTYEQIVKRLKEEKVGFDNQLGALERTLQAKKKDYEELMLLSGDANHAREVAQQELERVRAGYEEERRRREAELREKHQVVQLRRQMRERADRREKMKADIVRQELGDLTEEGEQNLKKALAVSNLTSAKMATDRVDHKSKIDLFENAFRKIKEATGVSDVNEVIQKIVSQEGTTENLMQLTKENQAKIEALNQQKAALKARVEEVKYSGPGEGHRRKMVDDHEELLSNSVARLERVKQKYEHLAKVLISAKAGVEHLQDKLKGACTEVGVETVVMTDDTVVDVLEAAEKTLLEVNQRIKVAEYEAGASTTSLAAACSPGGGGAAGGGTGAAGGGGQLSVVGGPAAAAAASGGSRVLLTAGDDGGGEEVMQARPFNQRIELPSVDDFTDAESASGEDGGVHDLDEDELTRDKVKKAATQVLLQQEKKNKKKPKRKGRGRVE